MSPLARVLANVGLLGTCSTLWQFVQRPKTIGWEWRLLRDARAFGRQHGFLKDGVPSIASNNTLLIVALEDSCLKAKMESLLAKAIQRYGYTPVILTYRWCWRIVKYYRAFGFTRFVYFEDFLTQVSRQDKDAIEAEVTTYLERSFTVPALKACAFHGVHVGRAALSTITRKLFKGQIDLSDPSVRRDHLPRWLGETMRRVVAAERLMDDLHPTAVLLNEKGYVAEAPIFEVALQRGINTIYWCHSHRDDALVLKRYTPETRHLQAFSLSPESWEYAQRLPWAAAHEHELDDEFNERYRHLSWWLSRRYQQGKRLEEPEVVRRELGLDPQKKTAVIFSHITWDASFFHGEDLFEDFEDWLIETIRVACANPALNWIVKLHPINAYKARADRAPREPSERIAIRTRIGALPSHIKLLESDTDINTFSLFPLTDYCLTVRGTIGIEMACFGIPVLTAGTGRYSGLGFTIDAATRADYLAILRHLQDVPRLTPEQTALAKRYAYVLFRGRPSRFTSFRTVFREELEPGHPFFWDFELRLRSSEELQNAPDLAAFARWAVESRSEDFLQEDALDVSPGVGLAACSWEAVR